MENIFSRLESLEKRYDEINSLLGREDIVSNRGQVQYLAQEQASIKEAAQKYQEYKAVERDLEEARSMQNDGLDDEMLDMVKEEVSELEERREKLLSELKLALKSKDPADEKDVFVEIRAGAGGEEAALFARDLFRMYSRYAQDKGWQVEIANTNETGIGGFKEVIFEIKGKGAYSRLKYERGVHRIQRVPTTESGGRIHTSTATVAVLPKADDVDVSIDNDDLRIDTFRASGAGGQYVNMTDSAVRITHLSTGMVVSCQDERSQYKNKTKALSVLKARLYDRERLRQHQEVSKDRRSQVGTGDRSEKIRTYNFPQSRVTDHRAGVTSHNLNEILEGGLDGLIDAVAADQPLE